MSEIFHDDTLLAITVGSNTTIVISDLSYGQHVFNITAYDYVNNTATAGFVVTLQQGLPDTLLLVSAGAIIGLVIILVIVSRRRR